MRVTLSLLFAAASLKLGASASRAASSTAAAATTMASSATRPAGSEVIHLAGGCFWCIESTASRMRGVHSAVSGYTHGHVVNPTYAAVRGNTDPSPPRSPRMMAQPPPVRGLCVPPASAAQPLTPSLLHQPTPFLLPQVCDGTTGHAEAVEVTFDPEVLPLPKLLRVFFTVLHDPTTLNRQGNDAGTQYRSGVYYTTDEQRDAVAAVIREVQASHWAGRPIVTEVLPATTFYRAEEYHQVRARARVRVIAECTRRARVEVERW
jgi:peptide-methionine (S)-S-oxide reductase